MSLVPAYLFREVRELSLADVEDAIVDELEQGLDDYQAFDWGPINKAFDRLRKLVEDRRETAQHI